MSEFQSFFETPEGKTLAVVGVLGLLCLGAVALGSSGPTSKPPRALPPAPRRTPLLAFALPEYEPMGRAERLAINKVSGADFEGRAGRKLRRDRQGRLTSQVTVTTAEGKRRRSDFVEEHSDGSVTPFEVKYVSELLPSHVKQAEDHADGLRNSGFQTRRPTVVVPAHAVVSEEYADRIDVIRIRQRACRS